MFRDAYWADAFWDDPYWGGVGGGGPEESDVADTGTDYCKITFIRTRVDVKITRDRGTGTSSNVAPVTVTFNKTFADIISIDVFPVTNSTEKIHRVINFVDAPDPVSFDLTLISDAGVQLTLPFGWVVEGILKSS